MDHLGLLEKGLGGHGKHMKPETAISRMLNLLLVKMKRDPTMSCHNGVETRLDGGRPQASNLGFLTNRCPALILSDISPCIQSKNSNTVNTVTNQLHVSFLPSEVEKNVAMHEPWRQRCSQDLIFVSEGDRSKGFVLLPVSDVGDAEVSPGA
jgi:hypothetical protein